MLYEYAIEPRALTNWKDFRYVIENLGISQGRLVSDFPKGWPGKVLKCCESFTFRQKQILTIELIRIRDFALIQTGRSYNGTLDWIENALIQHKEGKPFHAIIANYAGESPEYVIGVDDLTKSEPLWDVPRETRVLRTATELGNTVYHLLRMSKQIFFVDKMFADQINNPDDKQRWLTTLTHFIQIATENRDVLPEFEYHSEGRVLIPSEKTNFEEHWKSDLQNVIPTGTSLKLKLWTDRSWGKDFFHARYILTERGGVRIDWGLDESKSGEKTEQKTDVSLLDHDMWDELWRLFQTDSKTFQLLDYNIEVRN